MKTEIELLQIIYEFGCNPCCSHEGCSQNIEKFTKAAIELHYRFGYDKIHGKADENKYKDDIIFELKNCSNHIIKSFEKECGN